MNGTPATTAPTGSPVRDEDPVDWVGSLSGAGPERDHALRRLHDLMLRAARHQLAQMAPTLPALGRARLDDIVHQAADEATVALLGRLHTFEGRSRFTTWAYKFGILSAASEIRRSMWKHREVPLDHLNERATLAVSPEQVVEAAEFSRSVARAITVVLTPHQRRVVLALLVDGVPVDVLADRLGTNRNALYKTLHDARVQLRRQLADEGLLTRRPPTEVSS